ncbi:hypothetical protein [Methylocystis heyeri]|uniref:Uncharacterized protein n=1 Tax=Methylocystis heyeri TaxID=391905 RepID=A0A6B8KBS1_9HYPH|nr:hypothetical protein [Methylocystis heyeri]QGM45626.1 hypothetical protein H2LOC_007885 [Methylocystis heyeri]
MSPGFLRHLQENWPGALAMLGLALYLPIALATGVFYTNQRWIRRGESPREYWGWIAHFTALLLAVSAAIVGSYLLKP